MNLFLLLLLKYPYFYFIYAPKKFQVEPIEWEYKQIIKECTQQTEVSFYIY